MKEYLSYKFEDTAGMVNTFDELPLWSAPFGLLLLKHLEYRPHLHILDIGSGAGFPLMELAARFGSSCKCYGLDTWTNANDRARQKIWDYGLNNVTVIDGSAEQIPFENDSMDLLVSNLGINNFSNPGKVFEECSRVLKPGGKLALTTNLDGHWKEFYDIFEQTLRQLGKDALVTRLDEHQRHRGSIQSISTLFSGGGLKVTRYYVERFEMKFTDGGALLNHHFVKLGWLGDWMELCDGENLEELFSLLEENLDRHAALAGGLTLTVPMAFMEGVK